jgi:hypothetical protein
MAPGSLYDINRDMYYGDGRYEYERAMLYRRQEEEYRRMQNNMHPPGRDQQVKLVNTAPKPDPKDPLSFLSKADNTLLLTGEPS